MSIFDKTRYFKALFMLLPSGVLLMHYGINGLSTDENDLFYKQGIVDHFYVSEKYFDFCDCKMETFFINLVKVEQSYVTPIRVHIDTLSQVIDNGAKIEIWSEKSENLNMIKQVKLNGEMVISYNHLYVSNLIIISIGIGLTLLSLIYLFKSSGDLFGKSKE